MTPTIVAATSASAPSAPAGHPGQRDAFARALERAMERLDAAPGSGAADVARSLEPRRLLELQAAVYAHAERVEIVSKLADHAVGAVKTLLQTRV
jgi:hypothetical protein